MAQAKKIKLAINHDVLPPEMLEKILKLLNYKDICQAKLICRQWKEIIVNGNLVKKASGKILIQEIKGLVHHMISINYYFLSFLYIF